MSKTGEAFQSHYRRLTQKFGEVAHSLDNGMEESSSKAFVAFLKGGLVRHADDEEKHFLPRAEQLLKQHDRSVVTMNMDHGFIKKRQLLSAMHDAEDSPANQYRTLDVRNMEARQRHSLIFYTFLQLDAGDSFVLINDHDPKPFLHQFQAEYPAQLEWEYLEEGPEAWRVRISRLQN